MAGNVAVGLRTAFPVEAMVDFLLDDDHAALWLGSGGHLGDVEAGTVFVPDVVTVGASIQDVTRNRSSFRLVANWDDGVGQVIVRVTTCPGGRSRVRVRETGLAPEVVSERLRAWSRVFARLEALLRDASRERRTFRQAIVVVHGIGEQRPTTTLRNFVEAVFPEARGTRRFLKPDYISPLVGASSVMVPGRWTLNRPTTDVYELYWAHLIRDTTVGQVFAWAFRLLRTPKRNVTPKLWPHVLTLRIVAGLVLAALVAIVVLLLIGDGSRAWLATSAAALVGVFAAIPAILWKVAKTVGSPLQHIIIANVLGDAARYFDTSPANVEVRQRVREAGVRLLDDLHEGGRYGRIVVYGHSLGSVIAYDVLAHCWTRRARLHDRRVSLHTPRLQAVEALLNPRAPVGPPLTASTVQQHQHAAWNEFQDNGFHWLVSDLVTAGSPLTHGRWLLNPDQDTSFDDQVADRAMPTSPPQTSRVRGPKPGTFRRAFTFTHSYAVEGEDKHRSILVPDHAAPFALVRWTNVYFPHTGLMHGDPVGGPLQATFGDWIDDVPLPHPGGGFAGFAHTKYVDISRGRAHADLLERALNLEVTPDIATWLGRAEASVEDV
jgi:hypothetical protein